MALFDDPPLRDFPDRAIRRLLMDPHNLRDLIADVAGEGVAHETREPVQAPCATPHDSDASPADSRGLCNQSRGAWSSASRGRRIRMILVAPAELDRTCRIQVGDVVGDIISANLNKC